MLHTTANNEEMASLASQPSQSSRHQFSSCRACRYRRVKCDLRNLHVKAGPIAGVSCTNCRERGIPCQDEYIERKKQLRRGNQLELEDNPGDNTEETLRYQPPDKNATAKDVLESTTDVSTEFVNTKLEQSFWKQGQGTGDEQGDRSRSTSASFRSTSPFMTETTGVPNPSSDYDSTILGPSGACRGHLQHPIVQPIVSVTDILYGPLRLTFKQAQRLRLRTSKTRCFTLQSLYLSRTLVKLISYEIQSTQGSPEARDNCSDGAPKLQRLVDDFEDLVEQIENQLESTSPTQLKYLEEEQRLGRFFERLSSWRNGLEQIVGSHDLFRSLQIIDQRNPLFNRMDSNISLQETQLSSHTFNLQTDSNLKPNNKILTLSQGQADVNSIEIPGLESPTLDPNVNSSLHTSHSPKSPYHKQAESKLGYADLKPSEQSQMVPVQTAGGVTTIGVPIGHVNQVSALFEQVQVQPRHSPLPSPIDDSGMAPFLAPSMYVQQGLPDPPRRKHNITEVTDPNQYQRSQPSPKPFITPSAPPPKPHTVNINDYTIKEASRTQPKVQMRLRAHSQSGYVVSAAHEPSAPSSNYSVASSNYSVASSGSSGATKSSYHRATYQATQLPPLNHNDAPTELSQTTGPAGFGNRTAPTKQLFHRAALREPSQLSTPDPGSGRGDKAPVSMRPPNARMHVRSFPPTVISYDLNSEHRQQAPLRFGRFVYDRDVSHEEWEDFTRQLLNAWKERDSGFNRYHSAVRRINAILSAWNYAFFNPRRMDIVLFKGNERRSGGRYGQPEPNLDFLEEASPVSDVEEESSDDEDDEGNPALYLQQQDPNYRARMEREKSVIKAYRREERRREAASRPLEAPHSIVIYDLPPPGHDGESYH